MTWFRKLVGVCAIMMIGQPSHASGQQLPVRVASWNVFDLPGKLFHIGAEQRMRALPEALARACAPLEQLDAVAFSELYVAKHRDALLAALAARGLPHHAVLKGRGLKAALRWQGVVVASRWPIEAQHSVIFEGACHGVDCLSTKGGLYVRLRKTYLGQTYPVHLVATHLYLGKPKHFAQSRRHQAHALQRLMAQANIPEHEPIILAGDLNAPWHLDGPSLLDKLNAYAHVRTGDLDHTFVGRGHVLAGSPFQSLKTRCKKTAPPWADVPDNERPGRKWVDYVVALAPGPAPTQATLQAVPATGGPVFLRRDDPSARACSTQALSDHHLVVGSFKFAVSPRP
jgi:endonuclease/exonuclease/phosphatase family metal-dependent hydrolase